MVSYPSPGVVYLDVHVAIPRGLSLARATGPSETRLSTHAEGQETGSRRGITPRGTDGEPFWPGGQALGRQADGIRFDSASALRSSKAVVCGHV